MGFLDKLLGRGKAIAKEGMEAAETVAEKTADAAEDLYHGARERLEGGEGESAGSAQESGETPDRPSSGGGGGAA